MAKPLIFLFLTSKIKEFKINASFDQYEHLDLYQILKPYKNLWGLKEFPAEESGRIFRNSTNRQTFWKKTYQNLSGLS